MSCFIENRPCDICGQEQDDGSPDKLCPDCRKAVADAKAQLMKSIAIDKIAKELRAEHRGTVKAGSGYFGALQTAAEVQALRTPRTPEEALAHIREAVGDGGTVKFAPDNLTAQLNGEIQRIYGAIRAAEGREVKRPLWTADGVRIHMVLPWNEDGTATPEGVAAVKAAGEALGIPLTPEDIWEVAALRLRDHEQTQIKS